MLYRLCLKFLLTLTAAALPWAAQASDDPCFEMAQTQAQLNECAFNAWKRSDIELNHLYQQMGDRLRGDDQARRMMVDAQRKWLSFRDSECAFQTLRTVGASVQPLRQNSCLADLTRNRVTDFQSLLSCTKGAGEQAASECTIPLPPVPAASSAAKSVRHHDNR